LDNVCIVLFGILGHPVDEDSPLLADILHNSCKQKGALLLKNLQVHAAIIRMACGRVPAVRVAAGSALGRLVDVLSEIERFLRVYFCTRCRHKVLIGDPPVTISVKSRKKSSELLLS
jgi:hypothetical protein